jgi:hypothetical protein
MTARLPCTFSSFLQERLTAKQAVVPLQPGMLRTKSGPAGTVLVFAEGDAPYWAAAAR